MPEDAEGNLAAPRGSFEDSGAHDLEYSDSDDHFSDAQSGQSRPESALNSPIPVTRIEKVDNEPSYGEVPGTNAYNIRTNDAEPDEIAVLPEEKQKAHARSGSATPGGLPIPTTVVEKIDPSTPSHGEVPGTSAHEMRKADAVPDLVIRSPVGSRSTSRSSRFRARSTPGDLPIPTTKVEKVDSKPSHGEVPGTDAYEMRKNDAEPDVVEEVGDIPGSPTSHSDRPSTINNTRSNSSGADGLITASKDDYDEDEDGDDGGFGDDFDDFEEGDDQDFGDFDDGFQEPEAVAPAPQQFLRTPSFPVLDFDDLETPEEIQAATEPYLSVIFPPDTISTSTLPQPNNNNPIFLTDRSASLWSQLVAPPPLQPPNWIRSRIRRLFLVSLGVPVDLDEILPASKQKKLILPSTSQPRTSTDSRSVTRLKQSDGNASSTSVDSSGKPSSSSKRRKGPPPAPELDLVYARQLCTITDEALNGLDPEELKEHVRKLEVMQKTAAEVLEFWTKKTDELLGDREAFEGVIENLVKHARKVRK